MGAYKGCVEAYIHGGGGLFSSVAYYPENTVLECSTWTIEFRETNITIHSMKLYSGFLIANRIPHNCICQLYNNHSP